MVQPQLKTGEKWIALPGHLVANARDEVLEEIRRLVQVERVSVEVRMSRDSAMPPIQKDRAPLGFATVGRCCSR